METYRYDCKIMRVLPTPALDSTVSVAAKNPAHAVSIWVAAYRFQAADDPKWVHVAELDNHQHHDESFIELLGGLGHSKTLGADFLYLGRSLVVFSESRHAESLAGAQLVLTTPDPELIATTKRTAPTGRVIHKLQEPVRLQSLRWSAEPVRSPLYIGVESARVRTTRRRSSAVSKPQRVIPAALPTNHKHWF